MLVVFLAQFLFESLLHLFLLLLAFRVNLLLVLQVVLDQYRRRLLDVLRVLSSKRRTQSAALRMTFAVSNQRSLRKLQAIARM